ncbi:hypothetical protein D3C85_769220 [compost metagenome]
MAPGGKYQVAFGGRHPRQPAVAAIAVPVAVFKAGPGLLRHLRQRLARGGRIFGQHEVEDAAAQHFLGQPAQDGAGGRVDGGKAAFGIDGHHQVLRAAPQALALAVARGQFRFQLLFHGNVARAAIHLLALGHGHPRQPVPAAQLVAVAVFEAQRRLALVGRIPGRIGARQVVRMDQFKKFRRADFLPGPAQGGLPGGVRVFEIAVEVEHAQQVGADVPGAAEFARALGHLHFHAGSQGAQTRFRPGPQNGRPDAFRHLHGQFDLVRMPQARRAAVHDEQGLQLAILGNRNVQEGTDAQARERGQCGRHGRARITRHIADGQRLAGGKRIGQACRVIAEEILAGGARCQAIAPRMLQGGALQGLVDIETGHLLGAQALSQQLRRQGKNLARVLQQAQPAFQLQQKGDAAGAGLAAGDGGAGHAGLSCRPAAG